MKSIVLVFTCFVFAHLSLYAQEITEANYLKQDSILWAWYEQEQGNIYSLWEEMPEKRDSLRTLSKEIYDEASQKNRELAMQYASVPSGLRRLYMVRLDLSKDTVRYVLNSLNTDTQESFYGKNIREHLESEQIKEGDHIQYFPCTKDDGETFDWDTTQGKHFLMLYGGMDCMGKEGRNYLKQLYEKTNRKNFLIIVYFPVSSLRELEKVREVYPSDFIYVSDFQQDASPIKIKYGSQSTPTCFLTDNNNVLIKKFTGVNTDIINELIK